MPSLGKTARRGNYGKPWLDFFLTPKKTYENKKTKRKAYRVINALLPRDNDRGNNGDDKR